MPDPTESDELLLRAAGRGDLASFSQIVERHQTWAWRVAHRFTGNEEDASDIVQEAFLRLLDASGRYYHVTLMFSDKDALVSLWRLSF